MTSTAGSGNNGPVSDTDNGRPSTADATGHVEIENAVMGEKEEEEERDKQRMEEMMDEEKRAQEEEESTIPPTYARAHDEAEAGQLNEEATLPPDPDVATPLSESSSFVGPNDTLSVEVRARESLRSAVWLTIRRVLSYLLQAVADLLLEPHLVSDSHRRLSHSRGASKLASLLLRRYRGQSRPRS